VAPIDELLSQRFTSQDDTVAYWEELTSGSLGELASELSRTGSPSATVGGYRVEEVAAVSEVARWVELSQPPEPGTVWSTLTPSNPVDAGKALLTFDHADHYAPEAVLMSSRGGDCITARSTWSYEGRQFTFDFWVTVQPETSDPGELARCILCTDSTTVDIATRQVTFTGGLQRERVTVTTPGRVARLWHDGRFTLRFERCVITVL
jgi:hypothetical protein